MDEVRFEEGGVVESSGRPAAEGGRKNSLK